MPRIANAIDRKQISGCQGLGKGEQGNFWSGVSVLYLDYGSDDMGVMHLSKLIKVHI